MGDTLRDPVDPVRTTRSHAGASMTDVVSWPGYAFIAAAVLALVGSLAAFGSGHHSTGLVAAGIAVVVAVLGALWLMTEYRRVRGIEERWRAEHPEVPRPTGGH